MRRSLLVTVTNYVGSTQFYLSITHQRLLLVVLILALLSLVVGNGVLVWLGRSQIQTLQQAEVWRLSNLKSSAQVQKLQRSLTQLLPPTQDLANAPADFQKLLDVAPAAAASLDQLHSQAQQDHFTIQALERRLSELTHSRYEISQQLLRYTQRSSAMELSLRQLEGLLGTQEGAEFDMGKVPKMLLTARHRLTLLAHIPSAWPMAEKTLITSKYGPRKHPITGANKMHKGVDLRCLKGTPILATANGVVASSIKTKGFGNIISLTHSYGFSSRYAHLHKRLVKQGEFVQQGQAIGLCGSTGLSNAPHLHYEVKFLAKQSDPKPFMAWGLANYDDLFKQVQEVKWQSLIK